MPKKGSILVVVEFDNKPHHVLDRAIQVAGLLKCNLDILVCGIPDDTFATRFSISAEAEAIRRHMQDLRQTLADELVEPARDAGLLASTTILHQQHIGDDVLARALETEPCLVMKGTQFHSNADRSILVDTDWQLLRTCPYPLWFVKRDELRDSAVVIAAVDPMHENDKPAALDQVIVETAQILAEPTDGDVHLFHTYERLSGIGTVANRTFKPGKLPIDEIDARIKKEHRAALDALAEKTGVAADYVHQLPGRTRELLPTFVRSKDADLVVMGALARWGIKRMVIGSTAERVLDHLPCDILIVRAGGNNLGRSTERS